MSARNAPPRQPKAPPVARTAGAAPRAAGDAFKAAARPKAAARDQHQASVDASVEPRRTRDRSGYQQPNRTGRVIVAAYVEPDVREQFHALANTMRLTTQDLLTHLITRAIAEGEAEARQAQELRARATAKLARGSSLKHLQR